MELRCQVEVTVNATRRRCAKRISAVARPVRPTGRILRDLRERRPDAVAAWCPSCKRVSEFEYVEEVG